jgi:hypothetical protein
MGRAGRPGFPIKAIPPPTGGGKGFSDRAAERDDTMLV